MGRVTVIGYGNPLRGDDGVGRLVAQRLADRMMSEEIHVLVLQQLAPELAEDISRSDLVVFVDASCDQMPGSITYREVGPRPSKSGETTHHLDPSGLLAFAHALYGTSPKRAILITVGGESFGYRDDLSATVTAAMPTLERVLDACIAVHPGQA